MSRRSKKYDAQCPRCAALLPISASVCLTCGQPTTVPVQLPVPALPRPRSEAA